MTTRDSRRPAVAIGALGSALAVLVVMLTTAAGANAQRGTPRAVTIATVTTSDFRVAVVARRLSAGATPTAEVRAAVAQRVGRRWQERTELRLKETYFWRTVTGPRAVCRLEISTSGTPARNRPHVTIRLLQSPSLGCGPSHRIALPRR